MSHISCFPFFGHLHISATFEIASNVSDMIHFEYDIDSSSLLPTLREICHFIESLHNCLLSHDQRTISISPTFFSERTMNKIAVLVGTFLLHEGQDSLSVIQMHNSFLDACGLVNNQTTDASYFYAIEFALEHNWIEFVVVDGLLVADSLEEHLHYAAPAHGLLHIIVPNQIMVLPATKIFSDPEQLWHDLPSVQDHRIERHFSLLYYANLLRDLGFGVLATPGPIPEETVSTLGSCGLEYEDSLRTAVSSSSYLRAHDRLRSIRRAGAAVALQCGDDEEEWAHLLVLAQLVGEGMSGSAADAWLQLTCPRLAAQGTTSN